MQDRENTNNFVAASEGSTIQGFGQTPEAAIKDFDSQVNERFNIGRGSYITLERGRKLANNVQVNEVAPDDIQS
jgi:hypothetical protein